MIEIVLLLLIISGGFLILYKTVSSNFHLLTVQIAKVHGIKNVDEALKWAIGEDYNIIPLHSWDEQWRAKHPDLQRIEGYDKVTDGLDIMMKEYARHIGLC